MNQDDKSESKELSSLSRTQIARAIFAGAESMGMSDRKLIEQLTNQVIERLEQPQPLPGMEHLVPKQRRRQKRLTNEYEIQEMVKEILAGMEPAQEKEAQPTEEPNAVIELKNEPGAGINLRASQL